MRLEQFISDHLREVLTDRRVLTVFDPARRLLEVSRSLAGEQCQVIEVGDDLITVREQALELLAELGKDATNSSSLVLYLPRARPLDQEAVCLDPFTPLVLAGGVFPDGAGDSYLALCQRFLPEQAGVIEEMFQHGEPTFLEINSLVVGADGAPVLSSLLRAEGTRDLLVRFLCLNAKDSKGLKESPHWRKELQTLVSKTLGLTLPAELTKLDELRHLLWRFLLFSEFVADLPAALPPALGGVPKAAPKYHRFVLDLCATLRDRTSAQQSYEEFANRVAEELGLETHCGTLDDLGVLDTFAFEERCFLRTFAKASLAGDLAKAGQFVGERSKSFWIRDGARAGEWKLAGCCVDVLQGVADLKQVLKAAAPTGVAGWLDFQIAHGHRLDTAHRLMEQVAQDLLPEPGPLADVIARARETHREFVDRVTRAFQDAVVKEGWPVPGRPRANDIYDQFVRVPWQDGKRVAFFWIDAFRYDLAKLLAASASSRHLVTVNAVCAQLPTITKIGMAALLPGAGEDFRVAVESGELVPVVKGRSLPALPQRLDYIKEVVGANRFAAMELADILATKDLASLNHVEVLVVRTSEIDQLGENNPAYLTGLLPGAVRDLQLALNRLADVGFAVAVLATDHGFCWFDSVESGDAIQKPPGEWVEVKNRALLGAGQPNAQVVCVEAAHVGIRGEISRYVAARGLATFTKGVRYFHEGLSLQECLLPVLQVGLKPSPKKIAAVRVELFLTYRGANTGSVTTLRPSVEVSLPGSDLFGPADVSFVLEGFDSTSKKVAEAASSPVTDPATGEVRMLRGQSIKVPIRIQEGFNGRFELRAAHPGTGEIFATLKLITDFHH
ncbi:MAG: PglZ domain-containing protein [Limisphaerales bacterium]